MAPTPRNVLFITADQWRGECLGGLGHPCVTTPNLDRLAARGVTFARHYAQASPCGPSRASLYTGTYLHNHRMVNNDTPLSPRFTNMALEARALGLDPVLFGYTDIPSLGGGGAGADPKLLPGIRPVLLTGDEFDAWHERLRGQGYDVPEGTYGGFRPARRDGLTGLGPAFFASEHSFTAFTTDPVLEYLEAQAGDPWFAHVSYLAPHPPFIAPEPFHSRYAGRPMPAPVRAATLEEGMATHPYLAQAISGRRGWPIFEGFDNERAKHLSVEQVTEVRAVYYAMMSEVDHQVGRLLDWLDAQRAWDRTMVVFTSDHGEQLGDHYLFGKLGWQDSSFRIPLIVAGGAVAPRRRGAVVADRFTENVDILPSVLAWLGVEAPAQCDGCALTEFLRGTGPAEWRHAAHYELDFRSMRLDPDAPEFALAPQECNFAAIRDEAYKYVHFAGLAPVLHDLIADPGEVRNIAAEPGSRAIVAEYAARLLDWRMTTGETVLNLRE
jgi:arylsulfatase A-like enzyme